MDRSGRGSDCLVGLECLLDIVRALGMGSCFSGDIPGGLSYGPASASGRRKDRRKLRRTTSSSSSSPYGTVDSKMDVWLQRVPGRICSNGCSDAVSLFTKQGRKGINQDAMIAWEVVANVFFFLNCFTSGVL